MTADLVVRNLKGEEVHRVTIHNANARKVEKVMSGLLRNMSPDYYVDDSAFDGAWDIQDA